MIAGTHSRDALREQFAPYEVLATRVRHLLMQRFDAACVIDVLTAATAGDFYVCGGALRRALLGDNLSGDIDLIVPNGDDRSTRVLDSLDVPFVLNRQGHRRYRWNALQIDIFQPREFFRGFDDVDAVLRFFDLEIDALALHVASGRVLDPFNVLSHRRLSNPGINWPRWMEMSRVDVVVLAIRLAKIMHEMPTLRLSRSDAERLQDVVVPHIRECDWTVVHQRFPQGKSQFLRVFAVKVLARAADHP